MKISLLALIIYLIVPGFKAYNQENIVVIDDLSLKTYFQNSQLPAAIMGFVTKEGKMHWFAFGPAIWGRKGHCQ